MQLNKRHFTKRVRCKHRAWQILCKWSFHLTYSVRPLQWRHNGHDSVSNHQPHDCLLNRLFRRRSKETPKLRVTGLCEGNSPVSGEFSAQRASNAEFVSIWWRHHDYIHANYSPNVTIRFNNRWVLKNIILLVMMKTTLWAKCFLRARAFKTTFYETQLCGDCWYFTFLNIIS